MLHRLSVFCELKITQHILSHNINQRTLNFIHSMYVFEDIVHALFKLSLVNLEIISTRFFLMSSTTLEFCDILTTHSYTIPTIFVYHLFSIKCFAIMIYYLFTDIPLIIIVSIPP